MSTAGNASVRHSESRLINILQQAWIFHTSRVQHHGSRAGKYCFLCRDAFCLKWQQAYFKVVAQHRAMWHKAACFHRSKHLLNEAAGYYIEIEWFFFSLQKRYLLESIRHWFILLWSCSCCFFFSLDVFYISDFDSPTHVHTLFFPIVWSHYLLLM